ncbi:MAG: phosphatase PAP2 family protein [Propionibacteriales bacterium]|nr:phosphatase PAP2 family protein [Propionibacteriales bacterium]
MSSRRTALWGAASAVVFAVLTALVAVEWEPLQSFDDAALDPMHDWAADRSWVVSTAEFVDVALAPVVVRVVLVVTALVLWWQRLRQTAYWLFASVVGELVLVAATKVTMERPRPEWDDPLGTAGGWAFPSGHAAGGALFAGAVIVLAHVLVRRPGVRVAMYAVGVGFALLLGLDRLILGVHHPSDVIAGYLLVVVLLCGVAIANRGVGARPKPVSPKTSVPGTRKSRLAVVMNPAKVPDVSSFRRLVNESAEHAGWDTPMWFETSVDDAGRSMTHAALTAGADVVIAAGGDGTVRVVADELARTGVALGVLPAGTSNMLARNLSLPLQLEPALDVILSGQDRAIDLVRMSGDDMEPEHFAIMGGMGLDAAIMQGAPDELKKKIGWSAYFLAGLRHFRDPAFKVEISVDDDPTGSYRASVVVIGNVGTLTGGLPLLPDAVPDDGLLDVVVIAPRRFLTWVRLLFRLLTRRRRTDERLDRMTGRAVVVRTEKLIPRQMDGDTCGAGRELTAEIQPGVLLVRVPR